MSVARELEFVSRSMVNANLYRYVGWLRCSGKSQIWQRCTLTRTGARPRCRTFFSWDTREQNPGSYVFAWQAFMLHADQSLPHHKQSWSWNSTPLKCFTPRITLYTSIFCSQGSRFLQNLRSFHQQSTRPRK